ncbi:MAG: hypothetical protein JXA20_14795 [Spirochaetes bacterium]|nr:hypothetical protein [Spirochaetota bacterium]
MAEMTTGDGRGMRLNEYVHMREREAGDLQYLHTPFGTEEGGNFINRWQMNFARIEIFTRYRGFHELSPGNIVQIRVPRTDSGIEPLAPEEQPFGWDGKINEDAADLAVWRAFDLLTEGEAAAFFRDHCPTVIFEYPDRGRGRRLTVRHDGSCWTVADEE